MPLSSIVMSYKENCKAEGEIITRFKIVRHYFADHLTQEAIATAISCHRNTIGTVIRLCKKYVPKELLISIQERQQITEEQLYEWFSFFEFQSRAPRFHPAMLNKAEEEYIVKRQQETHFGPQRLLKTIEREGLNTERIYTLAKIKGVFKRKQLKSKKIRTQNGNRRALYEYEALAAFEQLQYDTKEILDKKALPAHIYKLFEHSNHIPLYQWTIIDAKTRTRFLAWSHSRNSWYGIAFLFFVICWLRAHGTHNHIHTQMDGGAEFCSASEKKLALWNTLFIPFGASVSQTEGVKWKQNLVERSHKPDDEEFYVPRGQYMTSKTNFLIEAQRWMLYWNTERPHFGIQMHGKTPQERLFDLGIYQSEAISSFPAIILDDFFHPLQSLSNILYLQNAQYVLTYYLLQFFTSKKLSALLPRT